MKKSADESSKNRHTMAFLSLVSRNLTSYFALKSIWLLVVSVSFLIRLKKMRFRAKKQ